MESSIHHRPNKASSIGEFVSCCSRGIVEATFDHVACVNGAAVFHDNEEPPAPLLLTRCCQRQQNEAGFQDFVMRNLSLQGLLSAPLTRQDSNPARSCAHPPPFPPNLPTFPDSAANTTSPDFPPSGHSSGHPSGHSGMCFLLLLLLLLAILAILPSISADVSPANKQCLKKAPSKLTPTQSTTLCSTSSKDPISPALCATTIFKGARSNHPLSHDDIVRLCTTATDPVRAGTCASTLNGKKPKLR